MPKDTEGALMWIFTKWGFLAIVQHKDLPDYFQVKSRTPDPLDRLWPDLEIDVIEWADYRFRINARKDAVVPVVSEILGSVTYTSFKGECRDDPEYHSALTRVWHNMHAFQDLMEGLSQEGP